MPWSSTDALAGVDANLLVVMNALLAEEHVGRAARRVGLSASAMSHALARLRELFGDPILVRSGQRMVATPRARELAPRLREGLALVAQAVARPPAFDPANERRTLRIAAVDFAQTGVLLPLIASLRREAPRVDVAVLPFGSALLKDFATGDLDIALAASRRVKGLMARVLFEEPFSCVARRGHPALVGRLSAKRFAQLDHVMISPRARVPGAADLALGRAGLRRRVALVVPNFLAAALAVVESDLVLTCASSSARQLSRWLELDVFAPPLKLAPFGLGMFWHERTDADPFLAFVRARLVSVAADSRG